MANQHTDSRRREWSHKASAGVTETWVFTSTDAIAPTSLSVHVGGTVSDVDDLTGSTEHAATIAGNVATVTVDIPTGPSQPLRLVVDGDVKTIGRLHPSELGSKDSTTEFSFSTSELHFDLTVLGTALVGGAFFIDGDGYVAAVVPSPDDTLTLDDDGLVLLTIGD